MMFVLTLAVLTLLSLGVSVLMLSAVGHLHLKTQALQAQVAAVFHETQFQSRVTRKAMLAEFEKVLPLVGYRPPKSTEEELHELMTTFGERKHETN